MSNIIDLNPLKLDGLLHSAVAATGVDEVALLRGGANAATAATETGPAALRLALVVLEDEEAIGANLELGAQQRLIGGLLAPLGHTALRRLLQVVVDTNGLVSLTGLGGIGDPVGKRLARRYMGSIVHVSLEHQDVGHQQQTKHDEDKCNPRGHF